MLPPEVHRELIGRLRKIEGQVQGIQRMFAEERDCREILDQLASVRAATRQVSVELMKHYAMECLREGEAKNRPDQTIHDVVRLLARMTE